MIAFFLLTQLHAPLPVVRPYVTREACEAAAAKTHGAMCLPARVPAMKAITMEDVR